MNSIKKHRRLLTLPEFLAAHPEITAHQLRYALRNREANGLSAHVFRQAATQGLLLDGPSVVVWFNRVVPA